MKTTRTINLCLMLVLVAGVALTAQAGEIWNKEHPRRAEVNQRLNNQNRRINQALSNGEMSPARAASLRRQDRQIRQEEHDMAVQDGGHITRQEQSVLNQQENRVSQEIGN